MTLHTLVKRLIGIRAELRLVGLDRNNRNAARENGPRVEPVSKEITWQLNRFAAR